MFETIGSVAQTALGVLMTPVRIAMEAIGLHPTDLQAWAFAVGVVMALAALPALYGDLVLLRRRRQATGMIVAMDTDSDGVRTPVIEFFDHASRPIRFSSSLPALGTSVGSAVAVVYDPRRPARAREMGRPAMKIAAYVLWCGVAAGAVAFAAGALGG